MGSSGSKTTTQSSSLPDWAVPYAQQVLQRGSDLSQQPVPQYTGDTVAGLTPDQQAAMDQIRTQATQGSQVVGAGNTAITNLLNGGGAPPTYSNPYASQTTSVATNPYIGQNPYLAQQVANAQGQTADAYSSGTASQTMGQFRNAGAFGGSAQQEYTDQQNKTLGNTLSQIATQMYGQDYAQTQNLEQQQINLQTGTSLADASRNAQYTQGGNQIAGQMWQDAQGNLISAAGLVPQLGASNYIDASQLLTSGGMQQSQNQSDVNAAYQQWYNQAMAPYTQLNTLQNALAGAMGVGNQGTQTTVAPGGSKTAGALSGAASGAAIGGMVGGPWGAGIGAVGGGLMGLFS